MVALKSDEILSNQCCVVIWIFKEPLVLIFEVFQIRRIVESGSLKQIKTKELSILSFSTIFKSLQFSWKNWKTWQFMPSYSKVGVGDDFVSQKKKKRKKKNN
jgi:hypothetical protein